MNADHFVDTLRIRDPNVRRAMKRVPRHEFVPPNKQNEAYQNAPVSIGFNQTISQPQLVAWMIELLELQPGDKVLEIGTGSGYETAVLAELGTVEVYSVEIIPELAEQAAARLRARGYTHVHLRQGNGYHGWKEHAPYAAIVVTAAPDHLPLALVDQLAEGGRLVIPIGPTFKTQMLWKYVRRGEKLVAREVGAVAFVPLTGAKDPASPG